METKIISIREEFVSQLDNNNIIRKSFITKPAIILAAGLIILCLPLLKPLSGSILTTIGIISGITLLCAGIIIWTKAPKYQYIATNKPIRFQQFYYETQDKDFLLDCLNGNIKYNHSFCNGNGNAILLEIFSEDDGNFIAAQLSNYVPYKYQVITETKFFHGDQAKKLYKVLFTRG